MSAVAGPFRETWVVYLQGQFTYQRNVSPVNLPVSACGECFTDIGSTTRGGLGQRHV